LQDLSGRQGFSKRIKGEELEVVDLGGKRGSNRGDTGEEAAVSGLGSKGMTFQIIFRGQEGLLIRKSTEKF